MSVRDGHPLSLDEPRVPVELPPLRDRFGDIPELMQYFLQKVKVKHGRADLRLSQELFPYFTQYAWPGNVRELENVIERMVILSEGPKVSVEDLPDSLHSEAAPAESLPLNTGAQMSLVNVERQLILNALEKFNGNRTQAARYLDMSRRTFAYRLDKYGVGRETLKSHKQTA